MIMSYLQIPLIHPKKVKSSIKNNSKQRKRTRWQKNGQQLMKLATKLSITFILNTSSVNETKKR